MAARTLQAKRYARALFEIEPQSREQDSYLRELQQLSALAQQPEIHSVMENPRFPLASKTGLLKLQAMTVSPTVMNLALLLTARGLFSLLTEVSAEYAHLLDEARGIAKAEVITAVALDDNQKNQLVTQLEAISGKKIILNIKVEPAILGGIMARVDGKLIDGSTNSQLASLKNDLANAGR